MNCDMSADFCARNDCCRAAGQCAMKRMMLRASSEDFVPPRAAAFTIEEEIPSVAPGDWLNSLDSKARKEVAMWRAFMAYFPDAMGLVARHSVRMNEKHNPGEPVRWARGKSNDQADCEARHLAATSTDPESRDGDGAYHMVCKAWRAMADLQLWAEMMFARDGEIK